MTRSRLLICLIVVLAVAAYPAWRAIHGATTPVRPGAAEPVQVVSDFTVRPIAWQTSIKAFGVVRAVQGADLSAQVAGIVDEIDFQSGQDVRAGTVLLKLRLYDDPDRLAQLSAEVALWNANLARDQKQFDAQAIARATLDLDIANLRSYQAQVAAQQQMMDEKIVRAPFSGRLGIRQVDLGQYLPAGTAVTSLQALDPIYVDFNVPQQQIADIAPGHVVQLHVDAWPGRSFAATITALDSRVDPHNRMVSVRASLGNADHALLPGMFATVQVDLGAPAQVLAIPQGAVSFNPYGNFVFVLGPRPDHAGQFVARSRVIRTADSHDDMVVVTGGLHDGDVIVNAGQLKLRDGSAVTINDRFKVQTPFSGELTDE